MGKENIFTPSVVRKIVPIPPIAWPTITLSLFSIGGIIVSIYFLHLRKLSTFAALIINSVLIFIVFTPMHDAAHGSLATVASGFKILNTLFGILTSCCFPLPFPAFRYLHLMHHKHTNDTKLDPDAWAGQGSWWMLPFKWMTIELRYYSIYFPILFTRPFAEAFVAMLQLVAFLATGFVLCQRGYTTEVVYGWVLPGRIALFVLAYCFDYLPHRPHSATRAEDIYKATAVTSLYGTCTSLLTWPLLHQNYHNIHHLVPYVPFYLYSAVWHSKKEELQSLGTDIIPVFGRYKTRTA